MVGGVGEKMLEDHGEQVFAGETGHHLLRLRGDRHRVAVVDDQRLDPGAERGRGLAQQIVADGAHVEGARHRLALGTGQPRRALEPGLFEGLEPARARQQQAAGTVAPSARQARQQRDQAGRAAAAFDPLHAVVQADRRRLSGAEIACQTAHFVGADTAHRRGALRRPFSHALAQRFKAVDMTFDVVMVEPVLRHQFVHHAKRQGAVGAGQQGDVLMALLSGLRAPRIDRDQLGAAPFGVLSQGPEMQVAGDRVAAPDHDQFALGEEAGVHADLGAIGRDQRLATGHRADGAVEQRGTQLVKKA